MMRDTALLSSLGEGPDVSLHFGNQCHQTRFISKEDKGSSVIRSVPSLICSKGFLKNGEHHNPSAGVC